MATLQFTSRFHLLPADGALIVIVFKFIWRCHGKPTNTERFIQMEIFCHMKSPSFESLFPWNDTCTHNFIKFLYLLYLYLKSTWVFWQTRLPGLHTVDDAQVILVSLPASLELMEQETQLHADHKARHAQEDITPYLQWCNFFFQFRYLVCAMWTSLQKVATLSWW